MQQSWACSAFRQGAEADPAAANLLRSLRDEGITILGIECTMDVVMNRLDHTVVGDFGSKLTGGAPEAIRAHTRVRDANLDWLV